MNPELLIAIATGLAGMLGWGLADLFAKKTIDEIGDIVTLVIAHVFGTLLLVLITLGVLLTGGHIGIPQSPEVWGGLIFFGVLQAAVYLLVYTGFGKGQVAVLNPLFASYSGIVAIISIAFLGELVTSSVLVALSILFLGILLLNIDLTALLERRLNFVHVPGFKEIAFATIGATVWTLLWNTFISGQDWLSYAMFMYVFMTITLLLYAKIKNIKLAVTNPSVWKYLILIGFFETGAYLAISWGFGATSFTSIVALLSGAFSLPTIFLARLFLKEQTTKLQAVASIIIVIGIMLLAVL